MLVCLICQYYNYKRQINNVNNRLIPDLTSFFTSLFVYLCVMHTWVVLGPKKLVMVQSSGRHLGGGVWGIRFTINTALKQVLHSFNQLALSDTKRAVLGTAYVMSLVRASPVYNANKTQLDPTRPDPT